ncbi:MAG: hypothetical protein KGZ58_02710 [Ignavibacteriales bacterium]|nr:hypothetical protein [Ignavibacteriales bacterium]
MKPKRYIVWSKREIDLEDSFQRKWYIEQVLSHGRSEDIRTLDYDEIKSLLPTMNISKNIRRVWENYFGDSV